MGSARSFRAHSGEGLGFMGGLVSGGLASTGAWSAGFRATGFWYARFRAYMGGLRVDDKMIGRVHDGPNMMTKLMMCD